MKKAKNIVRSRIVSEDKTEEAVSARNGTLTTKKLIANKIKLTEDKTT